MAPEEPRDVIWMRPEHAATGRPAQRSRAEITAAAVTIADREGLDAVSMRRVATELGTGAASLYRYVDNREDLLDLMIDATGAEYVFAAPTGDWLADLLDIGDQAGTIMRRHPWLPSVLITRSVLGPNGLVLLEHVLQALAPHSASLAAKLEAFAILNTTTALFVQNEIGGGSARQQRNAAYLNHVLASGRYPQLAQLLAPVSPVQASPAEAAAEPADRYRDILARVLSGHLALREAHPHPFGRPSCPPPAPRSRPSRAVRALAAAAARAAPASAVDVLESQQVPARIGMAHAPQRRAAGSARRGWACGDTASWGTAIPVALGAGGRDGYAGARDEYGARTALAVCATGAGDCDRAPAGGSGCRGGGGPGCRRRACPDGRRCRRWRGRAAAGRGEVAGAGGRSSAAAGCGGRGLVAHRRPVLLLEPGRRVPHPALPRQPRCGTCGRERGGAGRHRRGDVADLGVATARP
jgi:AcrR family transcriptional regulator